MSKCPACFSEEVKLHRLYPSQNHMLVCLACGYSLELGKRRNEEEYPTEEATKEAPKGKRGRPKKVVGSME